MTTPSRAAAPTACARTAARRPARWPPIANASNGTAWPERVREREQQCVDADLTARRDDGHGREHRPGARHHHEPEARPEQEPSADVASAPAREAREWALDQQAEAREDQRRRDDEEQREGDVSEHVERQAEQIEHPRGEEHRQREADDEAPHDRVRAAWAAGGRTGEQDGKHRQDARRQRRYQACDESDAQQDEHPFPSVAGKGCLEITTR